jgi:hypothetical protein
MNYLIKASIAASFEAEKIIKSYKKNSVPIKKSKEQLKDEEISIKPVEKAQYINFYI